MMPPDSNQFFEAIGIAPSNESQLHHFSRSTGVDVRTLRHYNETNTLPSGYNLLNICNLTGLSLDQLKLRMGKLDRRLMAAIRRHADEVALLLDDTETSCSPMPPLAYETELGQLHHGDCKILMQNLASDSIDLVFADPPFNLRKLYPSRVDDDLREGEYLDWCEDWLGECVRVLKPGGSLFVWNLPKWNVHLANYLNERLTFCHWIAVDIKCSRPIRGRLYPSHYSLLYYCKGEKPNTFHPDRLPMPVCSKCKADLRDYGGYKNKMNPRGVNLSDVWFDIPTVRHAKYKWRSQGNELSIKLLDRIIEMASNEGDIVLDPFGGSGTTYVVAEIKNRRWVGAEIGPVDEIIARLSNIKADRNLIQKFRGSYNSLFTLDTSKARRRKGLWTCESVRQFENSKVISVEI